VFEGSLKSKGLLLGIFVLYAVLLLLTAQHMIVDGDEAKYYTTIKEVFPGYMAGVQAHPGSAGYFFYVINGWWMSFAGVGYENGRLLNVFMALVSGLLMCYGLRSFFRSNIFPIVWLTAFAVNPYFLSHIVAISHCALSTNFLLMAIALTLLLINKSYLNELNAVFVVVLILIFVSVASNIRSHVMLAWLPHSLLILYLARNRSRSFFGISLVVILLTIPLIFLDASWFIKQPLVTEVLQEHETEVLQEDKIKIAATHINQTLFRTHELTQKVLPSIDLLRVVGAIHALVVQTFGFKVNGQHIFYFMVIGVALFFRKQIASDRKVLLYFCVVTCLFYVLAIFIVRYSQSTSYSYFFQPLQYLLVAAMVGVEVVRNKLYRHGNIFPQSALSLLLIFVMAQNFLFNRPDRFNDSPTYSIYKRHGTLPSDQPTSIYNLKKTATSFNDIITDDQYFFSTNHYLSPLLSGRVFPGTNMNVHKDFFSRRNWEWVSGTDTMIINGKEVRRRDWEEYVLTPQFSSGGTNPAYIVRMIENQRLFAIVDSGLLHADILPLVNEKYVVKESVGGFKLYVPRK